jgi:preprotein translocase subunit SecF
MRRFQWTFAVGMVLATASSVDAQVVGGVMSVTQSHMS